LRSKEEPVWKISKAKLFKGLEQRVDSLLADPGPQKDLLKKGYLEHLARARQNKRFLTEFVAKKYGYVNRTCPHTGDLYASLESQGGGICAA
jgi:hypothetical protein